MSSDGIQLNRRTVLVSLVVIGLAAAAAGAGTMAFFSDTESSNDNVVSAGTLDLKIGNGDSSVQLINETNAKPTDSNSEVTTLNNDGSINGSVDVNVSTVFAENDNTSDPESSDADEGSGVELADQMTVTIGIDENQDGDVSDSVDVVIHNGAASALSSTYDVDHTLTTGDNDDLYVSYSIPSDAGNEIQTDSVEVDATVELEQQED